MAYCLSGDIGGTKTLLQLRNPGAAVAEIKKSFSSLAYAGLDVMIAELLQEAGVKEIESAAFALAGPVNGRVVKLTNLPWSVDGDAIAKEFGITRVELLNDFEAAGYGLAVLQTQDMLTLQQGQAKQGAVKLLVGAGTGLGVAWLTQQGERYVVHASEGGHIDFAPNDEMQSMLWRHLQEKYGHVSYERVVSGMGLVEIYDFMRKYGVAEPSSLLLAEMEERDQAAVISHYASHEDEPIARLVMELFFSCYGAFAGNLALAALPQGGVYIAGGIAAKLAKQLAHSGFMQAFHAKGRFKQLLQNIPVHIVLNENLGLMGAGYRSESL